METPSSEEKTSPKPAFLKGKFRSEILRKKSNEKESAFLPRMAKYGWEGLDKVQAHWKPESNEYHAGAKDGCGKCAPKTPPLQMNGTDQKTPEKKVPDDTKTVAPSNLPQKTDNEAQSKGAPESKPVDQKAKKSPEFKDFYTDAEALRAFDANDWEDVADHAAMFGFVKSNHPRGWKKRSKDQKDPTKDKVSKTKVEAENVSQKQ